MSEAAREAHPSENAPDESGQAHGHEEHGGHEEQADHGTALGPINWGAGILGVAAGLAVAAALCVSTAL